MRPLPRSSSRRRALGAAAAALLVVAVLPGCVTRSTYREAVRERDRLAAESAQLAKRTRMLEDSNTSLSRERVELIDQVESLRQTRAELSDHVAALEAERDTLVHDLDARRSEVQTTRAEIRSLRGTYDDLVSDLQTEVSQGRIEIEQLREGLRMNLSQEILFPLGSARLDQQGRNLLRKVAARLTNGAHTVEVQGHTDDLPIHGTLARRFPSNWDLAGARAAEVVRLFEHEGVDPSRLRAVSYGPTRPAASNETAEGRAANRRIEIRLAPVGGPVESDAGAAYELATPPGGGSPGSAPPASLP